MSKIPELTKVFDKRLVKQRKGGGGMMLSYYSTATIIRRLNEVWQDKWAYEVKDTKQTSTAILCLGKLTSPDGISKEQWGSGDIRGKNPNAGDVHKTAASDALKKCATLFGVGLELYGD